MDTTRTARRATMLLGALVMVAWLAVAPAPAASESLTIEDATFTHQIVSDSPVNRLTTFSMSQPKLWFWFKLSCPGDCWSRLNEAGELPLEIYWYYDNGARLEDKRVRPVKAKAANDRLSDSWSAQNLEPGQWHVHVRFGTDQVCRKDRTCSFKIDVR